MAESASWPVVSPELTDRIFQLNTVATVPLLRHESSVEPIRAATTDLQLYEALDTNSAHLSTEVILNLDAPSLTIDGLYRALRMRFDKDPGGMSYSSPGYRPGFDVLFASDTTTNAARSVIVPELGGLRWRINSTIHSYKYGVNGGKENFEEFLQQHGFLMGQLFGSVYDLVYPQGVEKLEPIQLKLPSPNRKSKEQEPEAAPVSPFEMFAGIDFEISELEEFVKNADLTPEELEEFGLEPNRTVLLSGPSGNGKTPLMEALGVALKAETVNVDITDVGDMYTGQWAIKANALFEKAYKRKGRTLLVFDEAEGLILSGNGNVDGGIINVLKRQLEKVKKYPNVFVAFATNELDKIPEEIRVPKRMPLQLYMGNPDDESREQIIKKFLYKGYKVDDIDDVEEWSRFITFADKFQIPELVKATDEFSGSMIFQAFALARQQIHREAKASGEKPREITQDDILAGITKLRKRST